MLMKLSNTETITIYSWDSLFSFPFGIPGSTRSPRKRLDARRSFAAGILRRKSRDERQEYGLYKVSFTRPENHLAVSRLSTKLILLLLIFLLIVEKYLSHVSILPVCARKD